MKVEALDTYIYELYICHNTKGKKRVYRLTYDYNRNTNETVLLRVSRKAISINTNTT